MIFEATAINYCLVLALLYVLHNMHDERSLKALCHNIRCNWFLVSSLVQKFNREVWAHPVLCIVHESMWRLSACSAKIWLMIELKSSQSSATGS